MDLATLITDTGIVLSIVWTAWQEIRFQVSKVKQKIINTYLNSPTINQPAVVK